MQLAEDAAALVKQNDLSPYASGISKNGSLFFDDIDFGMYVVEQVEKSGAASDFSMIQPFIIGVPNPILDENGEYHWEYDAETIPKPGLESSLANPIDPKCPSPALQTVRPAGKIPKTGDLSVPVLPLASLTLVSIALSRCFGERVNIDNGCEK